MKGKSLLLTALSACCLAFGQAKYISHTVDEKVQAKDLTFLVTFDKHDVNANFAKGDRFSTTMRDVNLGLRGIIGFDGSPAYQPEAGEALRFPVEGNVDPHQGTLILWTAGMDYNPCDAKTDGANRGNIAIAHIMTNDGGKWIEYQLYEYGDTVYFDWRCSEGPQGWGNIGRVAIQRTKIRKGEWHQLAATWNDARLTFYLNGESVSETALPAKVRMSKGIMARNNAESFIGIKSPFYEDKHKFMTAVDDFAIYSRPLTPLEIRNQYLALCKEKGNVEIKAYSIELNGVNIGRNDKIERLEAAFDFSALPKADEEKLKAGKLKVDYTLTAPDGKKQKGSWTFAEGDCIRILDGVNQVGKYTLDTTCGKEKVSVSVERPDFSWVMNGYGDEDEVPEIWKDFALNGRTVTLWNRTYKFGNGPLPEEITAYGKPLLAERPKLSIDGVEPKWSAGKTTRTNRTVTFTGKGKLKNCTLTYETTVEFDGLINFKWNIEGKPEIGKMELTWKLAPENHQYLMMPTVDESKDAKREFKYPTSGGKAKLLWLVSEKKGGFAYTMVNDANWVYDAEKPVFFVDKSTGDCRVEMINSKVRLPENTPYQALFIATPTRPLPKLNRIIQYGDTRGGHKIMINGGGSGGFNSIFTHEPHPTDFEQKNKTRMPNTASVYGASGALTTMEPVANYLRKYWEVPGAYSYKMPWHRPLGDGKYKVEHYFSLSACCSGVINDYTLNGQHKLYNHKYADRIWQVYYDLCGDGICRNKLHGCGFKDKFGRDIGTYCVLYKRDLIRRTVSYAHKYGKTVMIHAQRDFIPMMTGLADYFFPGEQYGSLLQRNPFGYVDEVPDLIYRTEFNRDVLGIGVIHLPALGQADRANFRKENYKYTEAMICMLQSHDVDTSQDWAASKPLQTMWDAMRLYGVEKEETQCYRYYEHDTIKSSNPEIRITYYACPGGKYVLFLANKDIRAQSGEIDLNAIKGGDYDAREEYKGKPIEVKGGKFSIKVPSRSFRIVAFPPQSHYPILDNMDEQWGAWCGSKCDSEFLQSKDGGIDKSPCLMLKSNSTGGGAFTRHLPAKPGNSYVIKVRVRQENVNEGNFCSISVQGRDGAKVVAGPITKKINASAEWQTLELKANIPEKDKWLTCDGLLLLLGTNGKNCTTYFDDFEMVVVATASSPSH